MKNKLLYSALLLCLTLHAPLSSSAEPVTSLLYSCGLHFKASGQSAYIGLGYTDIKGEGEMACYDYLTGTTQHIPLKVIIRGPGAGLGITGIIVSGGVDGIGLSKSPESLLGRYLAVRGSAAVGVGAGVTPSLRVAKDAVVLDLNVQFTKGLGAGVDILSVQIEADSAKKAYTVAPVAAPAAASSENTAAATTSVPTEVITVAENQPVHILNKDGQVIKIIYLRKAH